MRWSLFSHFALLAVLIAEVTALPTPQDGLSEPSLERLTVTKPKVAGKAKVSSVKASNFKKSSQMYRNAALKGKSSMFSLKAVNIVKSKAPKTIPKGKYANRIPEAQTMGHAAREGGHSSSSLEPALKAVTDRINDPKNVAFVDPKTNRANGRAHTAVKSGKTPKHKNDTEFLKTAGKATAADVDKISKARIRIMKPIGGELPSKKVPYGLSIL